MGGITLDTLVRNVIAGTASSTTCTNGTGTTSNTNGAAQLINQGDIDAVVLQLVTNDAQGFTNLIKASTGQGTSPVSGGINGGFIGIANSALMNRIKAVPNFVEVKNYASPDQKYEGEWGATGLVRWILTTNGYRTGSSGSYQYYCPIIASNAYGTVKIPDGREMVKKTPPEIADPQMGRFSNYSLLFNFACTILQDLWIHTLICCD